MASDLNAVYGIRHDDDSVGGARLSGQAGAVWSLSPLARLRVNFAQGYKAPDDRSLYVDQVNPSGVPMLGAGVVNAAQGKTAAHTLKPEVSETFEIGIAGGGRAWNYGATVFRTRIEDRIEQTREGAAPLTYNTFRNISEARIDGIETEGGVPLAAGLRARLAVTALKAENAQTGAKLLNTPAKIASVSLDYSPVDAWMLQAIVRHVGEQDYSGTAGTATADAYTLLNLKASYLPKGARGLEIYGGINNLLDEKVDKALGSDPGPYLYAGLRYRF
jgi:outer membrane receptor for ferrienterochelin and colicins